jgi:RHS repeat-associated protein
MHADQHSDFTPVAGGASLFGVDEGHQGLAANAETGLVYNRHRYLHATLGRFTSPDPHPQGRYVDGMNGYEYVRSGPVGALDTLGLQATTPPNVPMPPRPNLPIPSGYSLTYSGPTVSTQRGPTQKRFMKTIQYQFANKIRPDIAYRDSGDSCKCWRPVIETGADQDLYELTREVRQYVSWTITGQWNPYTAFATAAGLAGGAGAVGRAGAAGYAAAQNAAATISQTARACYALIG